MEGCSLEMKSWHTCETSHCRGGWVTHLAGKEGKILEARFGMPLAAHIIYDNSSSIKVPWHNYFNFDNDSSLAHIKECAEKEKVLSNQ